MVCAVVRTPVAVARAGPHLCVGAARAAIRHGWPVLDQLDPRFVRDALTSGVRVLLVEMDCPCEHALGLIHRLSKHWNPMRCVAMDAWPTPMRESLARQAGVCAYMHASCEMEMIEQVAEQLLESAGSAWLAVGVGSEVEPVVRGARRLA